MGRVDDVLGVDPVNNPSTLNHHNVGDYEGYVIAVRSDSSSSSESEFQVEPLIVRTDKPHVGDTFWDSDDEPRVHYKITSVGRKYVNTEHTRWLISDALPRVNRSFEHMYTNNS